jgi:hypothetical protein
LTAWANDEPVYPPYSDVEFALLYFRDKSNPPKMSLFTSTTKLIPLNNSATGLLGFVFSWRMLAIVITAFMLAKWTWVFMAPKATALPNTSAWKISSNSEHLFGDAPAVSAQASNLGNIQLVGVFGHPSRGFAVLVVDGKQVGAGLGEEIAPGARLVATHADSVTINRNGMKIKVELMAGKVASGISRVSSNSENTSGSADPVTQFQQLPPEHRAAMKQELEKFRSPH